MWWKCPNCKEKVDFQKQMEYVFSDEDEVDFDPEDGLWMHTIDCKCGAYWTTGISKMSLHEKE